MLLVATPTQNTWKVYLTSPLEDAGKYVENWITADIHNNQNANFLKPQASKAPLEHQIKDGCNF